MKVQSMGLRMKAAIVIGSTVLALTIPSLAASYSCVSPVTNVSQARGGTLLIQSFGGSNWIYLCSMSSTQNGVSADECKTVFAALLAAQLAGKQVRLWFNDGLSCSTQAAWTYATGWYFGPDVLD